MLLRAGQFALSGSNQPGSERLIIDVTVRDEAAEAEGADVVVQKSFDGATPGHPGSAYFRYGTGRVVEAKVVHLRSVADFARGLPRRCANDSGREFIEQSLSDFGHAFQHRAPPQLPASSP